MDPSHRRSVRRSSARGLRVRTAAVERDVTDDFYRLHVRTRQRQGVPVQPRRYFALLWERLIRPGLGFVLLADDGDRPVAGAVFLAWNGTLVYKYGASTPESWPDRPNHLLLWEAICRGVGEGAHTLDLGRTAVELEGLATYKRRWGASQDRLVYSLLGGSRLRGTERGMPRPAAAVLRRSPAAVTRLTGELLYRFAA
jgi:lipid II:glycine glycyltransferase (peptidoglycan interpeptide bridge formation enzyme)